MAEEEQKIVSDEGFIESIRDLGITTIDAVNELVDNSFDADADEIWITIKENEEGEFCLIIEDNGEGIPSDQLRKILSFGGRLPKREYKIGKFGWGLSSSACCQSPRTEIYSKHEEEDNFHYNYIDLSELKDNNGILPLTTERNPYENYELNLSENCESGTVIVLNPLDRPDRKTKSGLKNLIREKLAEVQRKFLDDDRTITVNDEKINYKDPLMLMDDFEGIEKCGKGENFAEIEPIVFEDIEDENGEPASVEITISLLPVKQIMQNDLQDEFNINTRNQGFYIMRHKRQIAGGQSLYLFTKHNDFNYFRGEISFPPALDSKFGIQTNKSRFSLDDDLRDRLNNKLEKTLSSIREKIGEKKNEVTGEEAEGGDIKPSKAEEIADKASTRLKSSGYKPPKKEAEKEKEELEKEKEEKIEEVKEREDLPEDQKEELIDQIENAFQKDRTFKKKLEIIGSGEFYKMEHRGNRIEVLINTGHEFYKKIYERATQDPQLQILLDLFLFTLAQAEDQKYDNDEVRAFYNTERREWSAIMSTFLEEAERELENE